MALAETKIIQTINLFSENIFLRVKSIRLMLYTFCAESFGNISQFGLKLHFK